MSLQTGRADILFATYAATGAWDAGNLIPKGGSDGTTGQAFALAPQALDVGTYNAQLFSSSATASVDIASGQLHVTAHSDGPAAAYAYAHFSDLMTIVPTAGFTGLFDATFTLTVDGMLTGDADAGGELQVGSTVQNMDVGGHALCTAGASLCAPVPSLAGGAVTQTLVATIAVDAANPTVFIQPFLFAAANDVGQFVFTETGAADFGDTAQLSISLPEGFTFTSNSGLLLTQAPQPNVPEPGSWPLLAAGLGVIWVAARRLRAV